MFPAAVVEKNVTHIFCSVWGFRKSCGLGIIKQESLHCAYIFNSYIKYQQWSSEHDGPNNVRRFSEHEYCGTMNGFPNTHQDYRCLLSPVIIKRSFHPPEFIGLDVSLRNLTAKFRVKYRAKTQWHNTLRRPPLKLILTIRRTFLEDI
jgi:hypothetical protein